MGQSKRFLMALLAVCVAEMAFAKDTAHLATGNTLQKIERQPASIDFNGLIEVNRRDEQVMANELDRIQRESLIRERRAKRAQARAKGKLLVVELNEP